MNKIAMEHTASIYEEASLVIKIKGIGGKKWKRNVAKGARIGPWLQADYEIINNSAWRNEEACFDPVFSSFASLHLYIPAFAVPIQSDVKIINILIMALLKINYRFVFCVEGTYVSYYHPF